MLKRITAALLCLTILFSVSGCGKSEPKNANKKINYYLASEPKTLDPQIASDSAAVVVIEALFEGLVRLGTDNKPYPGVAEKWVSSENSTVFTFTLRSNATWSDDKKTPVTAQDFVYAFRRALLPQTGSPTCSRMFCIKNAKEVNAGTMSADQLGVTALDSRTLVLKLNYSYPDFPTVTAAPVFMPCNQKFFESTSGRYGLERKYLIGNGPFEIDGKYGWSHNQYLNLVRSDTYTGNQKPLPSNLKLTVQNKDNAIADPVEALESGKVDAIAVTGSQAATAKAQGCTITAFEDTTWGLCFNTQSELMKSKNIRRAFIQSFDRAKVLQHLPKNMSAAEDIIPPSTTLLGKPYREQAGGGAFYLKQDKNAASLLAAGLSELSLSELKSVTVLCPDDPNVKLMLNEMIAAWNVQFHNYFNMEPLSANQLASRIQSGNYQIALCPIQPTSDGPLAVLSLFKSNGQNNPALLRDSAYDALLDSVEKSGGADSATIANAEKYLNEQGVFYPLYYEKHYFAAAEGVTGVVFHPYGAGVDFIRTGKE